MNLIAQTLADGLVLGGIYALAAVGFSLIFGVLHVINLSHGILVLLGLPLGPSLALLPFLGIALNGTSSVLYGTVADLVLPERRSRAYGLYYTLTMVASSLSPAVYGVASDTIGVTATLVIVATMVLTTIPLCLLLRSVVVAPASA